MKNFLLLFALVLLIIAALSPIMAENFFKKKPSAEAQTKYAHKIKNLDPAQYHITQEGGTETPYKNQYWDNKKEGIYVDVISGEPLFSSNDKYDSGTGWPSFTKPISDTNITHAPDKSLGMVRTEVRSSNADSHLGHVFNDGPPEKGGMRYCINSSSLRFVPKEKLEKEGYGQYLNLFKK